LFNPENIEELSKKLLYLYEKHEFRESCGKNARHVARNCYISNTEPKIKNIMENVMENFNKM